MNIKRLENYFFRLLKADGPYRRERAAAEVIAEILGELGVAFYEDNTAGLTGCNSGNLIVAGSSRARLSFCAHMDTIKIYDKRSIQVDKGIISAAGGGVLGIDDRSGVAVLLEAIAELKEKDALTDDIHFIFTTCEEDGFNGAKYLDERHFHDALNFVVDSGGVPIGYTVNQGVGQYDFKVTVKGKMSHSGGSGGINSLVLAALLISRMKTGRLSDNTFVNICGITCQGNPNTVPECTEFTGQVLSFDDYEARQLLDQLHKTVNEFSGEHSVPVDFSYVCQCKSFLTETNTDIVEYARRAALKAGLEFSLGRTGAGSDAHIFIERGAKALKISNGMMKVHSGEEYIKLEDMAKCVEYVLALID